jgi:RecB family exonuclease
MKWLVERQLQPARLAPDPEPLTRGSYMHAVLERVFAGLDGPLTPESLPEAEQLLAGAMADTSDAAIGLGQPAALRRGLLAAIEADLRRYLRHEASGGGRWTPRWLELRFGFDSEPDSLPPLKLDDDVVLRGVIDRIDLASDGDGRRAVVRDYKSMSQRPEHTATRWRSERQLQVALYMLAARELLDVDPVAGFYQPLRGRELRARGLYRNDVDLDSRPPTPLLPGVYDNDGRSVQEFDELLSGVVADAVEIARRLRSGVLEPCPQTCSRDGCLFPGICRSS